MAKKKEIVILPKIIRKDDQLWTTSLDVAEKFGKRHNNVVRAIKNLDIPNDFQLHNFEQLTRKIPGGDQEYYIISRDGFSLLAMGFTGKEAIQWKIKYIDAFNELERFAKKELAKRSNQNWIAARTQGIIPQREKTDVIKEFVEYAIGQGSKNANRYYLLIQEMEYNSLFEGGYKHLKLLASYYGESKTLKDLLNTNQLITLANADRIAEKAINEGMKKGMFYKDIFKLAKERILNFASLIGIDQVLIKEIAA